MPQSGPIQPIRDIAYGALTLIWRWIQLPLVWLNGLFSVVRVERKKIVNTDVDPTSKLLENKALQNALRSRDQEIVTLKRECDQLRTRLSQTAAIQLTEGNPNIADLSDLNRPDKLAEQFSELYDNQWTDCYQILVDDFGKPETDSISILLNIIKTSYDICFDGCQNILTSTKGSLYAFVGRSDKEPDNSLDALIQEIFHKLKSHRTKNFQGVPKNIEKDIKEMIISQIGERETEACLCFIDECIRICWLMCIKDPPMYIFYDQEAMFDKNKYMEYTEMGQKVAYVVWPALYLHKYGPLMRKGVAQGKGDKDRKQPGIANTATSQDLETDHTQPNHTSIEDNVLINTNVMSADRNIEKPESLRNELPNENTSCTSRQHGDNKFWDTSPDDDENEAHQASNAPTLSNDGGRKENEVESFQSATNVAEKKSEEESCGSASSNEYCQPMKTSEDFSSKEENQMTETQDGVIQFDNGHEGQEAGNFDHRSLADNMDYFANNEEEKEQSLLIIGDNSTDESLKGAKEEMPLADSTRNEAMELKEHADVSMDENCKQREPSSIIEGNQVKETHDLSREYNKCQEVKEGINIVYEDCAKGMSDSSNNFDKEESQLLMNIPITSAASVEKETGTNSHPWTQGEQTKIKEQVESKLASSNEICPPEYSGGSNVNEKYKKGEEMDEKSIECTNTDREKGPINILPASLANNIGRYTSDTEGKKTSQFVNEHSSYGDNWKEGKGYQSSTQANKSKEQAENKLCSSDKACQNIESLIPFSTNGEENQSKEGHHEVLKCSKNPEGKEACHITRLSSEQNISDSPSDGYHGESLNLNIACSSSDQVIKDCKGETNFQHLTQEEEKTNTEYTLQLPDEHIEHTEVSENSKSNAAKCDSLQKNDWVIVSNAEKEVTDVADTAHECKGNNPSGYNNHNATEQEQLLKSNESLRRSTDDIRSEDTDNIGLHSSI